MYLHYILDFQVLVNRYSATTDCWQLQYVIFSFQFSVYHSKEMNPNMLNKEFTARQLISKTSEEMKRE